MDWILANWFWILIFVLFIAMHLFGHGGHGGHGGGDRQRGKDERDGDDTQARPVNTGSSGHQH